MMVGCSFAGGPSRETVVRGWLNCARICVVVVVGGTHGRVCLGIEQLEVPLAVPKVTPEKPGGDLSEMPNKDVANIDDIVEKKSRNVGVPSC